MSKSTQDAIDEWNGAVKKYYGKDKDKANQYTIGDKDKNKGKDKDKNKDDITDTDSTAVGTGIPFGGYTSAEIIREVVKKFITQVDNLNSNKGVLPLQYQYLFPGNNRMKVADMISLNIPDDATEWIQNGNQGKIFNPDEAMTPNPAQYMGYTGSVASMIKDLSNAPYNEIYWTFDDNTPQKAVLNYRQTPFEQEDWFNLPYVVLNDRDVKLANLDVNDTQQYSLFKLTSGKSQEDPDFFAMVPPITDNENELIARYGYKVMEVQSEYFSFDKSALGLSDTDLDSAKDQQNNQDSGDSASKNYPTYSAFKNYFLVDKKSGKDGTDTNKVDANDADYAISDQYGGEELYQQTLGILSDGNLSNSQKLSKLQEVSKNIATSKGNSGWGFSSPVASQLLDTYNQKKKMSRAQYSVIALPASETPFSGNSGITMGSLYGTLSGGHSAIKKHPNQAASDIVNLSRGRISTGQAAAIVKKINDNGGTISEQEYNDILNSTPHNVTDKDVSKALYGDKDSDTSSLGVTYRNYQQRLFNWYADNGKYYSGDITVMGRGDVQVGWRCYYYDTRRQALWEFYVESVSHSFSFDNAEGWTTTLGVTRGMKVEYLGDPKRFNLYWGKYADFQGGFFGEPNLSALIEEAKHNKEASSSSDSDSSSDDGDDSADGTISKGDLQSPVSGHGSFSREQDFGGPRGSGVHDGIDFGSMGWGHSIMAVGDGEIVYIGYDASWAHGMIVLKIKGAFVCYQEYSNNWQSDTKVKVGDKVKKGQVIAKMTNDHLHLGMSKSKERLIQGSYSTSGFLNPRKYLGV